MDSSARRRVVVASLIGTSLEWYDFFLYGLAAALVFNKLFFPRFDPVTGTLLAFATFAVGFVARPLGGIVFGHYGDRVGRKNVLAVTLLLMGTATFLIGVLPTYSVIGAVAPALLVTLRFLQGLGLGGEWGGAVVMSLESGDPRRRGFNVSWPQTGAPVGNLLATAVLGVLTGTLSDSAFISWGWRVPFLLSGVLVALGIWIRLSLLESPLFAEMEESQPKARIPMVEVLRRYPSALLVAVGCRIGADVTYYTFALFIVSYVTSTLGLPRSVPLNAVLIGSACQLVLIPAFGSLSDRFGRRPVFLFGAIGSAAWAFAFFALLDTRSAVAIYAAALAGSSSTPRCMARRRHSLPSCSIPGSAIAAPLWGISSPQSSEVRLLR
jgi:MFS family permease